MLASRASILPTSFASRASMLALIWAPSSESSMTPQSETPTATIATIKLRSDNCLPEACVVTFPRSLRNQSSSQCRGPLAALPWSVAFLSARVGQQGGSSPVFDLRSPSSLQAARDGTHRTLLPQVTALRLCSDQRARARGAGSPGIDRRHRSPATGGTGCNQQDLEVCLDDEGSPMSTREIPP